MACRSARVFINLCIFKLIMNGTHLVHAQSTYTPRSIQVTPPYVRVDVGEAVNVSCSADGVPAPTYAWYFESNTQAVSTGQTLSIPSAQPADNGQYTCFAINTKGNASFEISISVWYAPILTTNTSPQFVDEGSTLTLKCTIDANPSTYSLSWLKDGNLVDRTNTRLSGGIDSITSDLTITNIQSVDAGSYQCRVYHIVATSSSDIVDVQIALPPQNIVLNPSDPVINLNEGDPLTLTCSADAVPSPTYTWKAGSTIIGSGSSLVITSAGPVDNRDVTCEVINSRGSITRKTRVNVSYTPRVTIPGGASFEVNEGNSLTIPCVVDANPADDNFRWLRDSNALDLSDNTKYGGGTRTSRNLTIYSLALSDAGYYSCRSVNSVGNTTSREVIVTVNFSPQNIVLNPSDPAINLTEGDPLTLTCSADAVPSPTYTWKAGSTVIGNGGSLVINSAGPVDNREVTCEVTNSRGRITKTTRINVSYTPRVTIPGGAAFNVDEGNSLTISCVVDANPADDTFDWLRDSKVLDLTDNAKYGGGTRASRNLTIYLLASSDAGYYSCRSVNSVGNTTSREVIVTVNYKPTNIQANPRSLTIIEGSPILVPCSADGVPSPTFSWRKGEVTVDGPVLNVTHAETKDAGIYICRATNEKGTASVSVVVNVQYKPRVTSLGDITSEIGGDITIPCSIVANPNISSVTWQMMKDSVVKTLNISNLNNKYGGGIVLNPSLTINDLDIDDVGQYQCKGTNPIGSGSGSYVTVILRYKPENIQLDQNTVIVNESDSIVVTCSARGVPLPTYTWFREEVNIRNGSVLNVTSAKPKDTGRYTCQASNDKGTANVSLTVTVQYKPRGEVANQVFQTTAGTEVTLTCRVNANPPATGYEWSFGGVTLDDTGSSLVVTPSDSSDFGQYTCTASNTVGTSDPIIITLEQDVTPGEAISSEGPSMFLLLIIIPVLLLIIIIVVIVMCCCRGKLKKNKEDEDYLDSVPATSTPVTSTTTSLSEKPIELNNAVLY